MSLIPYTVTALEEDFSNAQSSGKNIVVGAAVTMTDSAGVVTMFDDAAGSNGSTAKVTGAIGQVTVFVEPNIYTVSVNGSPFEVVIADTVPAGLDAIIVAVAANTAKNIVQDTEISTLNDALTGSSFANTGLLARLRYNHEHPEHMIYQASPLGVDRKPKSAGIVHINTGLKEVSVSCGPVDCCKDLYGNSPLFSGD